MTDGKNFIRNPDDKSGTMTDDALAQLRKVIESMPGVTIVRVPKGPQLNEEDFMGLPLHIEEPSGSMTSPIFEHEAPHIISADEGYTDIRTALQSPAFWGAMQEVGEPAMLIHFTDGDNIESTKEYRDFIKDGCGL